jgi:hypothetical protein
MKKETLLRKLHTTENIQANLTIRGLAPQSITHMLDIRQQSLQRSIDIKTAQEVKETLRTLRRNRPHLMDRDHTTAIPDPETIQRNEFGRIFYEETDQIESNRMQFFHSAERSKTSIYFSLGGGLIAVPILGLFLGIPGAIIGYAGGFLLGMYHLMQHKRKLKLSEKLLAVKHVAEDLARTGIYNDRIKAK